jgi:hypothetical protein
MNSKGMTWLLTIVFSTIGSYIPALWGAGVFSFSAIILGAVGAMFGIWLGYKLNN